MDYEKKYKALVESVKALKEANPSDESIQKWVEDNVPELKESEDERIRKALINFLKSPFVNENITDEKVNPWIAWLEKQGEQKTQRMVSAETKEAMYDKTAYAWGEEDGSKIRHLIAFLDTNPNSVIYSRPKEEWIDWLKSLRPQNKNEMSKQFEDTIREIKTRIAQCNGFNRKHREEVFSLLDSLRPQNRWKPSKEQLHYLSWIANIKLGDSVVEQEVSKHLNELLEDLKKLKE